MPKTVTAYQCDHCAMVSLTRASVLRHEREYCRSNESRRSCHTCAHLQNGEEAGFRVFMCAVNAPDFRGSIIDLCSMWQSAKEA